MILFAGLGKFSDWPFDAAGYLANVDSVSPASGIYASMAGSTTLMEITNIVIPTTQVLIGIALITGAMVRIAAFGGALQMIAFYLGGWPTDLLGVFDSTLIYALIFLSIGAFSAGRILGLDSKIENLNIVKQYPKLKYILG